jgi:S1-C subfamily serine protease
MAKNRISIFCLTLIGLSFLASVAEATTIEASVVRIINHYQRGRWDAPWGAYSVGKRTGSGFVIQGGLIMTNAHVVSDSRMLLIYLNNDPRPYEATVKHIGHDCDLAVLEPIDKSLLSRIPPVKFGGLPELRSTVETLGYPSGGQRISSTKGVVSRIEMNRYIHSMIDYHLTVQTDAAINPGNSGGPVVQKKRVVGVAFQGSSRLENAGWFIPVEVVQHFLIDIADGKYDGFPDLAAMFRNMENPAYRHYVGLKPGQTGMIVENVYPKGSGDGYLRSGDVILKIDGHIVANDGTVAMQGLRLDAAVLLDRKQNREIVNLDVWRQGKSIQMAVPMRPYPPLSRKGNIYDQLPRYFIYAGLVFVPLNVEVLKLSGRDWNTKAPALLRYTYKYKPIEMPSQLDVEPVVFLRRLDHPINADMPNFKNLLLQKVNGLAITKLEDLVSAIESNPGPFQVLEFEAGIVHILDSGKVAEANADILRQYGIPRDRRL